MGASSQVRSWPEALPDPYSFLPCLKSTHPSLVWAQGWHTLAQPSLFPSAFRACRFLSTGYHSGSVEPERKFT